MKSIKVKIDVDKSSIKSISDEINKIAKNTKVNIDVTGAEKSLGALVNSLSKLSEKLDALVKRNPFEPLGGGASDADKKIKQLQQSFEKFKETAQSKIDKLNLNKLVDSEDIKKIQDSLNNINIDNFKASVKGFDQEFNNILSSVNDVRKAIEIQAGSTEEATRMEKELANAMAECREQSEKRKQASDRSEEIAQTKAINKSLDKEANSAMKAYESISKFKSQYSTILNELGKKVDSSAIDDLKNKLNSFDINTPKEEIRQFKNEVSSLAKSTSGVEKVGNVFQSLAKSTIVVSAVHQSITALKNSIRDGIQYIQELDSALTDISITTGLTGSSLTNIAEQVQSMAVEMGTSATSVMNVAKTYANAKDSMDSVLAKSKTAVALSNISGLDTTSTTKALNTVSNAFKLMAEDGSNATEVTERIGDVLTSVSKNMQYDFGAGIQELVNGIQQSGNVAEQAGISLERYSAMIGAVIEATGRSGLNLGSLINLL